MLPRTLDPRRIDRDELTAAICRRSFAEFVKRAWPNVPRVGARPLKWNWHHDAIVEHLEAVARGDIRYLLINQPPRSLKTELTGVFFLPWIWTWDPDFKVISASVVKNLATETSGFCRQVVETDWYRQLFTPPRTDAEGNVSRLWTLRTDKNRADDFANTLGGQRLATSVGATVIGKGGDLIVGDDLQADNQTQREWDEAWSYFSGTLSSRADDPATVRKVVVQQRLGKGDMSDRILEHGGYVHCCIRDKYDPKRSVVTNVAGRELFRDPRTEAGELLNPRMDPPEVAKQTRADAESYSRGMGPRKVKAQLDQDPEVDNGGEVLRTYWRFYRHPKISGTHRPEGCVTAAEYPAIDMPKFEGKVLSMDTAVKEEESNDWTVIGSVGYVGALAFVGAWLDRQHTDIMGMERMLKAQAELEPDAGRKVVEDKASGTPLVQRLKGEMRGLEAFNPGALSKVERLRLWALPTIAAGQCYLPEGAPWLDEFVAEFGDFPGGRHDDQVDFLVQGLRVTVAKGKKKRGILDLEW